ncbi:MAG: dephospho-CoA kinase [Bacteroidota bacterium]
MKKILKVGITGGIGSGKSIVTDFVEQNGFKVIRSDLLAKEIMIGNNSVKIKLKKEFGEEAYSGTKLNTGYLAKKIFSSKTQINKINSIVHPPTIKKIKELIKQYAKNANVVFVESALIFEAKFQGFFDYIILVSADEKIRIGRVVKRDRTNVEEVRKRMSFQISETRKKLLSDFIVENNSNKKSLGKKVLFVIKIIKALSQD